MVAVHQPDIEISSGLGQDAMSIDDIIERLERGLAIIAERQRAGLPVARHEDHWITLLHTYERLVDSRH